MTYHCLIFGSFKVPRKLIKLKSHLLDLFQIPGDFFLLVGVCLSLVLSQETLKLLTPSEMLILDSIDRILSVYTYLSFTSFSAFSLRAASRC